MAKKPRTATHRHAHHRTPKDAPTDSFLNVIFHGTFGYVVNPTHIGVMATNIREHVYLAGNWEREIRLEAGLNYVLHGVSGPVSMPMPNTDLNCVPVGFNTIDHSPDKEFCAFCLPFPIKIYSARLSYPKAGIPFFSGSDSPDNPPKALALIQIFTYHVTDRSRVALCPNFPWTPNFPPGEDIGYANLHIWAEPIFDMSDMKGCMMQTSHVKESFESLVAQFSGLDLHLEGAQDTLPDKYSPAPGVSGDETQTLAERYGVSITTRTANPRNCYGFYVDNS